MIPEIERFEPGQSKRRRVTLEPGTYRDVGGACVVVMTKITVDSVEHYERDPRWPKTGDFRWRRKCYDWETAVVAPPPPPPPPPPPTRWERLKAWLNTPLGRAPLPKARQLLPTKIWRDPLPEEVDPNADL